MRNIRANRGSGSTSSSDRYGNAFLLLRPVGQVGQGAEQLPGLVQPRGELVADLADGPRPRFGLGDQLGGVPLGLGDPDGRQPVLMVSARAATAWSVKVLASAAVTPDWASPPSPARSAKVFDSSKRASARLCSPSPSAAREEPSARREMAARFISFRGVTRAAL